MACSVRHLSQEEADQVAMIYRAAFDERLPWLAGSHTSAEDRVFFRTRVFIECQVWGAVDEALIGFIAFRDGWVDQLHVLPHHQRQGAGRALLQVAKAASASLMLWTFQRNTPARRFYEKQGFLSVKETDGSGNEEHEPDVLYRWQQTEARPADTTG